MSESKIKSESESESDMRFRCGSCIELEVVYMALRCAVMGWDGLLHR